MEKETFNQEENVEVVNETTTQTNAATDAATDSTESKTVLLGNIAYTNPEDYEKFLANLHANEAIFVLIASANYGQARGLYNLDESELIAKAIKTIKKTAAQPTNVTSDTTADTTADTTK